MPWTLILAGYVPTSANRLLTARHWSIGHRFKREAIDRVAVARILAGGIPDATGKRRVSVAVAMAGRGRSPDPDNLWKVLADSLVANRLLVDDSADWLEMGPVTVGRWPMSGTMITLEDLDDDECKGSD